MAKTNSSKQQNLLVAGDWVVDEHWVTGVHRSRTSSRVGQVHRRVLQTTVSSIVSFCGAGRTASILFRAIRQGRSVFNILGLGVWHQDDTECLESLIDPAAAQGRTQHQLIGFAVGGNSQRRDNFCRFINLAPKAAACGTTKAIRIYQQGPGGPKLLERVDWEIKPPDKGWYSAAALKSNRQLTGALAHPLCAVVIKDMAKGAVTTDLIRYLFDRVDPRVPWFVSSKRFQPDWLDKAVKARVRLLEIPQAAANEALERDFLASWITRSGQISRDALAFLDKQQTDLEKAVIVAIPDENHAIAKQGGEGVFWCSERSSPLLESFPMASVCFAALIANCLANPNISLGQLVGSSFAYTADWRRAETQRIWSPEKPNPSLDPRLPLDTYKVAPINEFNWGAESEIWSAAMRRHGIIQSPAKTSHPSARKAAMDPELRLEIWRAMGEVNNYICIDPDRRRVLRELISEFRAFRHEEGSRSAMIIAPPGSGKSKLARLIAAELRMEFLEFNITQMVSKSDIVDCFDHILATQFENQDRSLLVFVDEIDAEIQNQDVFDTFLAPLESGIYKRGGRSFPIRPCVWLFAATKDPKDLGSRKASDFVSRLTKKPPLPLIADGKNSDERKLENVYLGATLLRAEFADVQTISEGLITIFHMIRENLPVRELRQFVKAFTHIQYGEVKKKNLPFRTEGDPWYERLGLSEEALRNVKDGRQVRIVSAGDLQEEEAFPLEPGSGHIVPTRHEAGVELEVGGARLRRIRSRLVS